MNIFSHVIKMLSVPQLAAAVFEKGMITPPPSVLTESSLKSV